MSIDEIILQLESILSSLYVMRDYWYDKKDNTIL